MVELGKLTDAERLEGISQRVGFALWQLQELEGITATYLVLVSHATQGIGAVSGSALLEKALSKTFGATVRDLIKADKMPTELDGLVRHLLNERNWLVHGSRASSRAAVRSDVACAALIARIDEICDHALDLMRKFGTLAESFVKARGVTSETIHAQAAQTLKKWHSGEP